MKPHGSIAAVAVALIACTGDGPIVPEGPEPPSDDTPAAPDAATRVLPEGTYEVTYSACQACAPGAVPDYLLMFGEGVRGTVTITNAAEWHASLRLVDMSAGADPPTDILGLFGSSLVALLWDTTTRTFEGRVPYGAAAEFVPSFRVLDGDLRCEFDLFHAKHDVGATSCSVSERP